MIYSENLIPYDCIIVGGGLSGLTAARQLHQKRKRVLLLEATDRVGGRVKTDVVQGFKLDHGFQVYLSAYPTAYTQLNLSSLSLGLFENGALVRVNGKFWELSDPWRNPKSILSAVQAPVGTLRDKWKVGQLRNFCLATPSELLLQQSKEATTKEYLSRQGFSMRMIDQFFRPFFGGIFLDEQLSVSAARFLYLFRIFSQGNASLPAEGMEAIPQQIAASIESNCIRTNATVTHVTATSIKLDNGITLHARNVIVATEASAAAKLLGTVDNPSEFRSSMCYYFAADKPPTTRAILMLNGDETNKPINSVAILSNAQRHYAPVGQALISVSCMGRFGSSDQSNLNEVVEQLVDWFGADARQWRFLRSYPVPCSLPDQSPSAVQLNHWINGVRLAGDHLRTGSIEGAIESGLAAASDVLERLA